MIGSPQEDDMVRGYLDGRDPNAPLPSSNRSASYRHAFLNGRAEIESNRPRAPYAKLLEMAEQAMEEDRRR